MELRDNGYFLTHLYKKYAIPSIAALLAGNIGVMLNSMIAGNCFGSDGLYVVGVFTPIFFLYNTLGALIGVGAANSTNNYIAKNDFKSIGNLFTIATILNIIVGALLTFAFIVFRVEIIHFFAGEIEITEDTLRYYYFFVLYGVASMYIYTPMNFTRLDGKPNVAMKMFIAMAITNVGFAIVTLFLMKLGVWAIAFSSFMGGIAAVLVGCYYAFSRKGNICLVFPNDFVKNLKDILLFGSPMSLNNFYNFLKVFIINSIFINIGAPTGVSIFAVVNTLSTFIMSIASGIGQSIVPLVGVFNGKYDVQSVRGLASLAFKRGNIVFLVLTIVLILGNDIVCNFYNIGGESTANSGNIAILCFSLSLCFGLNNTVLSFYYTSIGRLILANIINLLKGLVYFVGIALILSSVIGEKGVWLALILGEMTTLITMVIIAKYLTLKDSKLSGMLLINTDIEKMNNYLAFSVEDTPESLMAASEAVSQFCEEKELDMEEGMFMSLSVEEIINLIKSRFENADDSNNDSKLSFTKLISVRLYLLDEGKLLTFMYPGEKFNPIEYFEEEMACDFEKSLEAIGVKYIIEKATNIKFTETFGVNNLSIEL